MKGHLVPFLIGAVAIGVLISAEKLLGGASFLALLSIEVGLFLAAGLLACAIARSRPFLVGALALAGVVAGWLLDLVIHPTISGGGERNLWPLELAFLMLVALPSFLASAVVWTLVRKDA